MRWFWLFIFSLCVLTGVLYTQRVSAERAEQARLQAEEEAARNSAPPRRPRERQRSTQREEAAATDGGVAAAAQTESSETIDEEPRPAEPEAAVELAESEIQSASDPASDQVSEDRGASTSFRVDGLLETLSELGEQLPEQEQARKQQPSTEIRPAQAQAETRPADEPDPAPVGEIVIDLPEDESPAEPEPGYEQRADGSFRVIAANAWVQGAGTASEPYVLSWDVLKSIEKQYDPRNGKDTLPDWLDLLEGKVVQIEGNTLVPVVASTTRELLVMQNPWDGCCIGVPPTPYDAVEVSLNHDVDFGNSAVGFGSVQGTFYVDPYVVDGWVLGVYIIEDATYRSGEGVVFPEF